MWTFRRVSNVVRATLADQAYRELRSRVLTGQLPSGHRLLPDELALDLSISPTPIKEALLRLEADGLVVSSVRRGATVRRFTEQDIRELYEARALIELDAIGRGFTSGRVGPGLLGEIRETLVQHAEYARRNTLDDLATALVFDRRFHTLLIEAGGNGLISEWHQRILAQTHTVFVVRPGDYARSIDEHQAILDALEAGSSRDAKKALARHLARSRDNTLHTATALVPNETAQG
jgi:DNA-binding GntR family transcriptional regulator